LQLQMTDDITALIRELKDLKIREADILARLEAANERNRTNVAGEATTSEFLRGFVAGDRVKITNVVRKPSSWPNHIEWDARQARRATVTKVDAASDRVYFVTDNGTNTWRMPANLKRL
jgi:hypothetical protein